MIANAGAAGGRPIRFLVLFLGGWIGMRILLIAQGQGSDAPGAQTSLAIPALPPLIEPAVAGVGVNLIGRTTDSASRAQHHSDGLRRTERALSASTNDEGIPIGLLDFMNVTIGYADRVHPNNDAVANASAAIPPLVVPPPFASREGSDRWTAAAWAFWRDGSAITSATETGRLGGSQIGARVDFDLAPGALGRVTAYARATAALNRPKSPEAAAGIAYQPSRAVPVSLMIERRTALGPGGRNANAVLVVGGFGPTQIGPSLEAEGYSQTGIVGFRALDPFVDGKLSLLHRPVGSRLRIGASLSGGAQPGVSRIDLGPELHMRLPLPGASARLGLEWRERVAGDAEPRSGLAMTFATDF